jgi:hypothetical protein
MVSVIISSANPSYLEKVSKNIRDTIGLPYELITFDNSLGQKGICEIYNQGILKAKYDTLCFMHEDIEIQTNGWGGIVLQTFSQYPQYGLIGLVGSDYKPLAPSGWSHSGNDMEYGNLMQSHKFKDERPSHFYKNKLNSTLTELACVDGVWFCAPKKVAEEMLFDQATFKGFHAYDLDFSLKVGCKYKVGVIYNILINHFSEGNFDRVWLTEVLKLHDKWCNHLPLNIPPYTKKVALFAEKATFQYFIDLLIKFKMPMRLAFKMLYQHNRFAQLNIVLFLKLHYYILKKYIAA